MQTLTHYTLTQYTQLTHYTHTLAKPDLMSSSARLSSGTFGAAAVLLPLAPVLSHVYMELDGVPQKLVDEAVFPTDDDQVQALATAFHSQRSGYTETRSSATLAAANAAAQLGVPFADPDVVCCALSCTFRDFVSVALM